MKIHPSTIPATPEERAAQLLELRAVLASIQEGLKDPVFAEFFATSFVKEGVEGIKERVKVLELFEALEGERKYALGVLDAVRRALEGEHAHMCPGGDVECEVCATIALCKEPLIVGPREVSL